MGSEIDPIQGEDEGGLWGPFLAYFSVIVLVVVVVVAALKPGGLW